MTDKQCELLCKIILTAMQERNLCSQGKPYQFLCSEGMLHRNQKEIEGPNIKILSMKKRNIVDSQ